MQTKEPVILLTRSQLLRLSREELVQLADQYVEEIKRLRIEVNRATLCATYAIWERAQETDLRTLSIALATERHQRVCIEKFKGGPDWMKCMREHCVSAKLLVEHSSAQEVDITNFGLALMQTYALKFSMNRDSDGNVDHIKARLIKRSELPPDAPQEQGRIIVQ